MQAHTITLIIGILMASAAMIAYPEDHRKEVSYANTVSEGHDTVAYNIL